MKERLIFIVSSILVIFGIIYLSVTSYNFINRDNTKNTNSTSSTVQEKAQIAQIGESNKEIISENLSQNVPVNISVSVKNNSQSARYSDSFEGRVYQIKELLNFPNVDSETPKEIKTIPVAINANETNEIVYTTNTKDCGNFYIAIGDKDFWQRGRGVVSYGFYSVKCANSTVVTPTPGAKSPMADKVLGTKTKVLPKSGSESLLLSVLGVCFALGGVLMLKKVGEK